MDISSGQWKILANLLFPDFSVATSGALQFGILVFHAFVKKAQKMPEPEKKTARARLREFLAELESER